jgi:hypothetical protein
MRLLPDMVKARMYDVYISCDRALVELRHLRSKLFTGVFFVVE